ncbi:Solute carrier family 35 member G1 (Partner of STIM1) (Transmembrane protein 20) [Durusdinium trenchii]|uniref:Solute carrier family 35 member G1 (Partner of STIM1) (Transmembrane protein 20) n=1 Tax=Durusdinium trenchii TaxID=1381693 RepID=A0ABP0SCD0_9DINO
MLLPTDRWPILLILLVSAFGFSVQAFLVRCLTLEEVGSFQILTLRGFGQVLGSCLCLSAEGVRVKAWLGTTSSDRMALLGRAFIGYLALCFSVWSVHFMPLADWQIWEQTAPMFSAALARVFLKEHWSGTEFWGALGAVFGVALMEGQPEGERSSNSSDGTLGAVCCGLLSASFSGGVYALVRFLGTSQVHWASTVLSQSVGLVVFSPVALAISRPLRILSRQQAAFVLAITLAAFASQAAMTKGIALEKTAVGAMVVQSFIPVFSFVWQQLFFLPNAAFTWQSLVGLASIFMGVSLVVKGQRKMEYQEVAADDKKETGDESPNQNVQCMFTPDDQMYGKRSFFHEGPGVHREEEMMETLQRDGFSRRQAELALTEVQWASPEAALDILDLLGRGETMHQLGGVFSCCSLIPK